MPHYVTKPKQSSRKYYIFATSVMGPVSEKMYRTEMEAYLKENGYECWLDSTPINEDPEALKHRDQKTLDMEQKMMYWNGSFWYVTEEDMYFV